jgi:IMP dehydrogenase
LTANIELPIPIVSSPMDTVTESEMAIALAQEGGIGIIHKNMSIETQTDEVEKVKRSANGIIENPATLPPSAGVADARELMQQHNVSGVPIVRDVGHLEGILTKRDLRFLERWDLAVSEVMTSNNLVTATGAVTLAEAETILMEKKVEKLLLVDEDFKLTGLITIKDIDMMRRFPNACKDSHGRLRAGAAVGVHDFERAEKLIGCDVDVLVVDSAHGHSANVIETVRRIKREWDIDVIAGNIATEQGCRDLIEAGADAVKVGIGPGSICTTRVVTGAGMPQITAIAEVADVAAAHGVPVVADGGIRYSGDAAKAIAAGADAVMLGSYFAGTDEAPGRVITMNGKKYKQYRGMGSVGAMRSGGGDRYLREDDEEEEFVPEGVEAATPYKGSLASELHQLVGGMRSGMGYVGAETIPGFKERSEFVRVSQAGQTEGHPHDVMITDEAPNYSPSE